MIYLPHTKLQRVDLLVRSNFGGMGDMIARLPALKQLVLRHPQVSVDVYWYDYFVPYAAAVLSHERIRHLKMSDWKKMSIEDANRPTIKFDPMNVTSMKTHLARIGYMFLLDEVDVSPDLLEYLPTPDDEGEAVRKFGLMSPQENAREAQLQQEQTREAQLPKENAREAQLLRYVVVTTGYTAPTRRWKETEVNVFCKRIKEHGLTPVFLGKKANELGIKHKNIKNEEGTTLDAEFQEGVDYSVGIDLRDKTTLIEAANIMRHAKAVVGLDNGLLHLSATTNVPSVWGFTSVQPGHRLPYRDGKMGKDMVVIAQPQSLGCRYCQSKMHYIYGHDYRKCFYQSEKNYDSKKIQPLPYQCLDYMKAESFVKALETLGVINGKRNFR